MCVLKKLSRMWIIFTHNHHSNELIIYSSSVLVLKSSKLDVYLLIQSRINKKQDGQATHTRTDMQQQ